MTTKNDAYELAHANEVARLKELDGVVVLGGAYD